MPARVPLPEHLTRTPFSLKAGVAAGLGRKRLLGPDLQRPFRGVRASEAGSTVESLCRAFQTRMPPHAFFCSVTAAALMGVPLPLEYEQSRRLHVSVSAPHRALTARGIVGSKRDVRDGDIRDWRGLPISAPEQLWCELAALLSLPDLVAAGDYLIHWRLPATTLEELRAAVHRHSGKRGNSRLREALTLLDDRAESPQESRLRVILQKARLKGLVSNLPIRTRTGSNYRADFAFPKEKVILEYQSDYHREPERYRKDMTRRSRLEADGWVVMLLNADDLRNPIELIHRIRLILADR